MPSWRRRLLGQDVPDALATAPKRVHAQIHLPIELANAVSEAGIARGFSRQGMLNTWVAEGIARETGMPLDDVLALFPARRQGTLRHANQHVKRPRRG